ncbi:hypothetical protein ABPG74_005696 [Tetrahymena malaccensis]
MKQDDLLTRERSISDYQKPVNNSRISHHFKQKYQFTNSQAKSFSKHIKNFAENHYFALPIGTHSNISGQQLANSSQNNTKHTQNNCLSSFSQEGYYSDSQKLTPRMNYYLSTRTQPNEAQDNKDSDITTNQGSQSQTATPRYYFNYKMLLQNNKILPNQFISKIASNSTAQQSDFNLKHKENECIKNKEIEQNFQSKNDQQIFKQAESFIYDEKQNNHLKDQKNTSFFINSQTVSDLILEDMTPSQFKISNAPSFLDQKQEAILNSSNLNNQVYPLIDNLLADSFNLDEGCKQPTDSELILKNPNEFFQKVGIKPLQSSQNKKKPLNVYLTEHVEKELAMMKQFDQSQIQDKKLNSNHFNTFFQQSKELIQQDQQLPYQSIDQLIQEKKQSNKLKLESPQCSQKNLNLIILKNKYNVVKERIKIEKKDQTTSYLYENRDQLKLEYEDIGEQPSNKKKNLRDILLNNKEKEIFNSVANFKKTLKLKQMLKFQDIVQQTFQNHKKNQHEINQNQQQNNIILITNTLQNEIHTDQTANKSQERYLESKEEEEKKQEFTKSSSLQINKVSQLTKNQEFLKQFSMNQEQNQKDKQTQILSQKSQENDIIYSHQIQQKIQDNQQINPIHQNQLKLNFCRVFSSKQLNSDGDKIQSNPQTQRSQTPKLKFKNQGDQTSKNVKLQSNKIINLKKSFQQNLNQINKKNRIYSASPNSHQKVTSFSFLKPQKQLRFSKDLISDRPYSSNQQNNHKNNLIQKSNQNISSSSNLKIQNYKNENESFKEQEKSSCFNKSKNQKLFEKLKQLQKNKQNIQKHQLQEKYFDKKQLFNNNNSEGINRFQGGNYQNNFQKDEENEILNSSFVISKQHVKNELNTVEKQIQNQRLLIDNIQQKKGEYLSPFREKPSNQFIYDHMFYQKHIQLLISVNKKYENLDL